MLFWTIIKVGLKSLLGNPLRSFLTMLGIIIGVGAAISMLAIIAGAEKKIMTSIAAMGTNLLVVRPGQSGFHGVMSGTQQTLTMADAQAVRDEIDGVRRLAPGVSGSVQVKYQNHNTRTRVTGTAGTYLPIRDYTVEKGRVFSDSEVENMARVVVLGPVTVTNLFGENEPLDETVKVNGINFKVIGVLKAKGDQGFFSSDDQVIMPYTTAMKQVLGLDRLGEIDIQVSDGFDLTNVQTAIQQLVRKRHHTQEGAPDDVNIINQADIIATASQFTTTFTVVLGGIASIALLVGGIGIMNIMLVTVTERTREIGVRKAIGAKERGILLQFLTEAVIMSGLGGMLGVGAGIGLARLIEMATMAYTSTPLITEVQVSSILLALSFSAVVGIVFGSYPAYRAARLDPVDALRYE
jgi:ABC-type antimicrobial peptide transport system permease subunit